MSEFGEIIQLVEDYDSPIIIYREDKENLVVTNFKDFQSNKYDKLDSDNEQSVSNNESIKELEKISKKDILKRINKDISLWRKKIQKKNRDARASKLKQELKGDKNGNKEEIEDIKQEVDKTQDRAPNYINYSEDIEKRIDQNNEKKIEEIELEDLESGSGMKKTKAIPYHEKNQDDSK